MLDDLTIDDIFPPTDADAAAILKQNSSNFSKSGLKTGQIDPNPIGFGQPGSQLIEAPVFMSSDISEYLKVLPPAPDSSIQEDSMESGNEELEDKVFDEKRKSKRKRNRESAELYRESARLCWERKRPYVEELEDKVRIMHSTIQDLNLMISHLTVENATLKSHMGSTGVPSQIPPPPGPGMYPWMPYMVKPQVPLVPIPRLTPQPMAPPPKRSKKVENKKTTEMETKKVASITYLGLLFFMLLFGGLVPKINLRYGGLRAPFTSRDFSRSEYNERHHGRVLTVDWRVNGSSYSGHHNRRDFSGNCSPRGDGQPNFNRGANEFIGSGNGSEPLKASLYLPRNDKLVKIDGNLIIHSVLASEKAMASHRNGETGLAAPGNLAPAIPGRHPYHYRRPADGSGDKEKAKSTIQQWFLEGVAGPMLSSGVCTEVFQFDVSSSPGLIVPTATVRNVSMEQRQNASRTNKGRNRRILDGLSVPATGVPHDISEEHEGRTGKKMTLLEIVQFLQWSSQC